MVTSWPAYTEYRNRFSCPFSLFPPTTSAFNWVLVSSYTTKPFTHHSTWQRAMLFHAWSLTEWKFLNDTFNCRTTTINWYVVTAITVPSIIQANLLQHIAHHCRLKSHIVYVLRCVYVRISDFGTEVMPKPSTQFCTVDRRQLNRVRKWILSNTQPTFFLVLSVYIIGSLTVYKHELGNTNSTTCIQGWHGEKSWAKIHNATGHKEWVLITVNSAKHLNQTIEYVP